MNAGRKIEYSKLNDVYLESGSEGDEIDWQVKPTKLAARPLLQNGSSKRHGLMAKEYGSDVQQNDDSVKKHTFTLEEAMNSIGWGKFQVWLTAICGLGNLTEAMEMMILTILSPALLCEWGVSSTQQALVTTFVFVGMMIGAASWGIICDRYGRKNGVLISFVITFFYGVLSAFSPTIIWIYLLRGVVGAAFIGGSQTQTMQVEFTSTSSRVNNLLIMNTFWALGNFFVIAIAVVVMPTLGWRWQLIICTLPLFVSIIIIWLFLPESVRYQMTCGNVEGAMKTIKMMARHNGKPMPKGELYVPSELMNPSQRGRMSDLLTPKLRRTTLMLWYIWFATAFVYYGMSLMTTELMKTKTGCTSSDEHAIFPPCALECAQLDVHDYLRLMIVTSAEFLAVPNSFLWTKCLTRKRTLFALWMLFALFTALLTTCISKYAITGFLLVTRVLCSSLFQVIYLYTLEVYPTSIRALGLGTSSSAARVGGIITPFIAQVMLEQSMFATVGVYTSVGFIAGIVALLLPIETKYREISDFSVDINH